MLCFFSKVLIYQGKCSQKYSEIFVNFLTRYNQRKIIGKIFVFCRGKSKLFSFISRKTELIYKNTCMQSVFFIFKNNGVIAFLKNSRFQGVFNKFYAKF